MKKSETAKLIGIIKARYPRANWGANDELTVEAWHMSLGDLEQQSVVEALRHLFTQSPFPPDPVDVRSWIMAESGMAPEASEAWRIAQTAIAIYYPGHEFNYEMPEVVRQTLKDIGGVHNLKMSENSQRDREAFMRAYPVHRKRALSEPGLGGAWAIGEGRTEELDAGFGYVPAEDTVVSLNGIEYIRGDD